MASSGIGALAWWSQLCTCGRRRVLPHVASCIAAATGRGSCRSSALQSCCAGTWNFPTGRQPIRRSCSCAFRCKTCLPSCAPACCALPCSAGARSCWCSAPKRVLCRACSRHSFFPCASVPVFSVTLCWPTLSLLYNVCNATGTQPRVAARIIGRAGCRRPAAAPRPAGPTWQRAARPLLPRTLPPPHPALPPLLPRPAALAG